MKLLLTNDDGIDAPGLKALAEAVADFGEITVVAPAEPLSGCSHRVTTGRAIRMEQRAPRAFAVEGTPADCVRVALHELGDAFDWVLAGVNEGGNLGCDVFHSGTVAAVREAALHGLRGIAVSQYRKRDRDIPWERVVRWTAPMLRALLARPANASSFWNVNLPHLDADAPDPATAFCPVDTSPLPLTFRREGDALTYTGNYHQRRATPGSDLDACFRGLIAVSELSLAHGPHPANGVP